MKQGRSLPALLDAHSAELAGCRRCGHAGEVLPIVSEARSPRVMLVGQAPGKSEITDRRPFAGRAGKTLFRWFARAGLSEAAVRAQIYIAAVTRCYPGPSPSGRGDRVPSPRERELCGAWLDAELRVIRPRLILPVGRLAIDRFLGAGPLDELVGTVRSVRLEGGRSARVIALPHPSGASSWLFTDGHSALLDRALELLRDELQALGVREHAEPARRSA